MAEVLLLLAKYAKSNFVEKGTAICQEKKYLS